MACCTNGKSRAIHRVEPISRLFLDHHGSCGLRMRSGLVRIATELGHALYSDHLQDIMALTFRVARNFWSDIPKTVITEQEVAYSFVDELDKRGPKFRDVCLPSGSIKNESPQSGFCDDFLVLGLTRIGVRVREDAKVESFRR